MQQTFISLRNQTSAPIRDLIEEENINCIHSINIIELLIGKLVHLAEEGVALAPKIIFCQSIASIVKIFPGSVSYKIDTIQLTASSVSEILKNCAAICGEQWNIFIERTDESTLSYGIFTYSELPEKFSLEKAIELCGTETCILVRKIDNNIIDISTSKGSNISVSFSTTREGSQDSNLISKFSDNITKNCVPAGINPENNIILFGEYIKNLVKRALDQCHGTILICCKSKNFVSIAGIKRSVPMSPAIDFYEAFISYRSDPSAESYLKL